MSVKRVTFFVCIMGMLLTMGCSNLVLPGMLSEQLPGESETRSSLPALEYLAWVETASQDTLARESARLEQELTDAGEIRAGVQLALVRSKMEGAVTSDAALGRSLLLLVPAIQAEPGAGTVANSDYIMLADMVSELLELKRELLRTAVSNEDYTLRVSELEREGRALRSQIEALKSIEEQLYEREQSHEPILNPE